MRSASNVCSFCSSCVRWFVSISRSSSCVLKILQKKFLKNRVNKFNLWWLDHKRQSTYLSLLLTFLALSLSHFHNFVSCFEILDPPERAAEADAEDHADQLDDDHAPGHGHQVDDVLLHELDQGLRTTLEMREDSSFESGILTQRMFHNFTRPKGKVCNLNGENVS